MEMRIEITALICFILLSAQNFTAAQDCPSKVVACYYSSWAKYRNESGQFLIQDINATLCTHLIYSFAGLDINMKISSLDPANDITYVGYKTFNELRAQNPCLKTLLALGGWNEGSRKYSVMASTEESRAEFAESALRFVATYDFDGLDLDWEYPTQRGGIKDDYENYVKLLEAIRSRFTPWNLLVTVAVPISADLTQISYNMAEINNLVDYIFLMAYDYTSGDSNVTGLLAPMTPITEVVDVWLKNIDSNKLVLGLPTYARSFTLKDENQFDLGAPTVGPGVPGSSTLQPGFLAYYELSEKLLSRLYKVEFSDGTYYGYYENDWLSFDQQDSYENKVNYALEHELGGLMVWSIDTDDFRGEFSDTQYPILNIIHNVITNKADIKGF